MTHRGHIIYKVLLSITLFMLVVPQLKADEIGTTPIVIRGGQRSQGTQSTPKSSIESDSLAMVAADSLQQIVNGGEVVKEVESESERAVTPVPLMNGSDSLSTIDGEVEKHRFFSDSMSLSAVAWKSLALPGYGQIYNKQYWKLPILYGALATGITLYAKENKRYQPLKSSYDEMTLTNYDRTEELDALQSSMIRSNTRRQIYLGATVATYIYAIGDAAMNYATNDVSDIKRATTLATICPGAGQIYNKSYWKLPFVVGGFASMIYVIDWNNRGYQRFKKAYTLRYDYDVNPDSYPDGSADEFEGSYSASYLQDIRDSYRRNRDLSIIMLAGLYILQIVDAHVDAHFKDFDVSDNLALDIEPMVDYAYIPTQQSNSPVYGFNIGIRF